MPGSQIVDLIVGTSRKQGQGKIRQNGTLVIWEGAAPSLFPVPTRLTIFAHYYLGAWNSLSTLQLLIQTMQPTSVKNHSQRQKLWPIWFFL